MVVCFGQRLRVEGSFDNKLITDWTPSDQLYSVGKPGNRGCVPLQRHHSRNEALHNAYSHHWVIFVILDRAGPQEG